MAGKARSLPRKDLEFIANDIGRELIDVMEPEDVKESMDRKKQKRLLALFSPEERLADLTPEERLADLTPEERLADLTPEERLADLTPEERLANLTPEERLADLTPEEFLKGMSPEKQKAFWDSLLKIKSAPEATEKQTNGDGAH